MALTKQWDNLIRCSIPCTSNDDEDEMRTEGKIGTRRGRKILKRDQILDWLYATEIFTWKVIPKTNICLYTKFVYFNESANSIIFYLRMERDFIRAEMVLCRVFYWKKDEIQFVNWLAVPENALCHVSYATTIKRQHIPAFAPQIFHSPIILYSTIKWALVFGNSGYSLSVMAYQT